MSVQAALNLGAVDLKKNANKSLAIAFLISLAFHITLLGAKYVSDVLMSDKGTGEEEALIATGPVTLDQFKEDMPEPEDVAVEEVLPPPPPMAAVAEVGTGSEGRMGDLVATEDDLIEGPEIADFAEIEFSDAVGGGDGGAAQLDVDIEMPSEINIQDAPAVKEEEYGMDDFVPEAEAPKYDLNELKSLVEYPSIARDNGIEGRVTVSVQVSTSGKPLQVVVRQSTNKIFESNAKDAVRKLRFSPAVQNGHPIKMWVTFNVNFKLNQ